MLLFTKFVVFTLILGVGGNTDNRTFAAEGHDLDSLLYDFLMELLVDFESERVICRQLDILTFDRETWKITATGCGPCFPPMVQLRSKTWKFSRVNSCVPACRAPACFCLGRLLVKYCMCLCVPNFFPFSYKIIGGVCAPRAPTGGRIALYHVLA